MKSRSGFVSNSSSSSFVVVLPTDEDGFTELDDWDTPRDGFKSLGLLIPSYTRLNVLKSDRDSLVRELELCKRCDLTRVPESTEEFIEFVDRHMLTPFLKVWYPRGWYHRIEPIGKRIPVPYEVICCVLAQGYFTDCELMDLGRVSKDWYNASNTVFPRRPYYLKRMERHRSQAYKYLEVILPTIIRGNLIECIPFIEENGCLEEGKIVVSVKAECHAEDIKTTSDTAPKIYITSYD